MSARTIRLARHEWTFDDSASLGPPGGFGEVFRGTGETGPVAVKRLNLTAGAAAFRELKIGEVLGARKLNHVVPILDFGQDALSDRYFLVMLICEQSLQNKISNGGPMKGPEISRIILDILAGLTEVDDIVHRDLKPGNVLYLDGCWRLADFGIAKFVEDSTSLQTLRECLTPAYGAPEQWRGEAASHATDVYALGCIAHTVVTGQPPFRGSNDQVREAHLHTTAPALPHADARLVGFVSQMLRKSAAARPTLARCIDVFTSISSETSKLSHPALISASARVAEESATADAAARAAETRANARAALIEEAISNLREIKDRLFAEVLAVSEEAKFSHDVLQFGKGTLRINEASRVSFRTDGKPNLRQSGWDVCAYSIISVERAQRPSGNVPIHNSEQRLIIYDSPYVWSSTLAFASTPNDKAYRWREISFWQLSRTYGSNEPFGVAADDRNFDIALSNVLGNLNVAFGPKGIDAEDEPEFQRRWLFLLSKAATGALERPNQMPISPGYFN